MNIRIDETHEQSYHVVLSEDELNKIVIAAVAKEAGIDLSKEVMNNRVWYGQKETAGSFKTEADVLLKVDLGKPE